MKSRELIMAMKELLLSALRDYPFPLPGGGCGDVAVFVHGLPDEQGARTYPFICVRWASGDIEEGMDGASALETLALVLGIHAPQDQEEAGLLLAELLDWLRATLRRHRVVARKFELQVPLRAVVPEPEKEWFLYHMATVYPQYNYVVPSTPLGRTLKEHTYE